MQYSSLNQQSSACGLDTELVTAASDWLVSFDDNITSCMNDL